jgi:hypothetical protein
MKNKKLVTLNLICEYEDIMFKICSFLNVKEVFNFSLVGKYFLKISNHNGLWKILFKKSYPTLDLEDFDKNNWKNEYKKQFYNESKNWFIKFASRNCNV